MKEINLRILVGIIVITLMIALVQTNIIIPLDLLVYDKVEYLYSTFMTWFMAFISDLGSGTFYFILCILFLLIKKKWGIILTTNVVLASGINASLKLIFERERPLMKLVEATGYSLPSGHSCSSMAFYGTLIYLVYKANLKHKKEISVGLGILILLIGFSRIYLHVHYFSDVVTGFMLGYTIINITLYYLFKEVSL